MLAPARRLLAAVVFLGFVGCASVLRIGNTDVQVAVNFDDKTIKNSIEQVAQKLERSLRNEGLEVTVTPQGETIRVASSSRSGQKFVLVLTRVQGPQGEQTRIRTEWDGPGGDRVLWLQLIAAAGEAAVTR
jgi:hypothetical protein